MRKLAICLAKGGVGKTTTATNLAHGLSELGKKVLLVDCDTQGQAAFFLGCKASEGLAEVILKKRILAETVVEARKGLYLLSGGRALADATLAISTRKMGIERAMLEVLQPAEDKFDFVLLDMAPGWDLLSVNALMYAKEIIAPVELQMAAIESLGQFSSRVKDVQEYNSKLSIKYVLPTKFDKRSKESHSIYSTLCELYPNQICDPIHASVRFFESTGEGKSIFEYAPKDRCSDDYKKFVNKVCNDGCK